jgi:predicted Zn-dependent protease
MSHRSIRVFQLSVTAGLTAVVLWSCSSVPITGRKQLSLVPDDQIMAMAATQYDTVLMTNQLSTNKEQTAMVKRCGARIQKAVEEYFQSKDQMAQLAGYEWEFNLIESDEVNAWCMPGGKVAFYTGILPICQDEAGIAVVMGHEVAHAVAKHGNERMSQAMLAQYGSVALDAALAKNSEGTKQMAATAFGIGATYGALMPFGRKQESEADHLGLIFMAMAGYDPSAAVPFWERIANLRTLMPEAQKYYKPVN